MSADICCVCEGTVICIVIEQIVIVRKKRGVIPLEERPGYENMRLMMQNEIDANALEDPKRRSKARHMLRANPDMAERLRENGLKISDSSCYRRFQPAKKSSKYGRKRHRNPLNARFSRARNNRRKTPKCHRSNYALRELFLELLSFLGMCNTAN